MKPLVNVESKVVPLIADNIDTDQLLPKQFLTEISRKGFGKHLMHDQRYLDDKEQVLNPDCELNMPAYQGAEICVAGKNFGCGSSREHAPWALADYGIRVIIAKSFADIFYSNCLNNQILPIVLAEPLVDELANLVTTYPGATAKVNLDNQTVQFGDRIAKFSIEIHHRANLMNGVDKIGRTLQEEASIAAFEGKAY